MEYQHFPAQICVKVSPQEKTPLLTLNLHMKQRLKKASAFTGYFKWWLRICNIAMKVIGSYCLSSFKKENHWPFPYFTNLDFINSETFAQFERSSNHQAKHYQQKKAAKVGVKIIKLSKKYCYCWQFYQLAFLELSTISFPVWMFY